MAASTTGTPPKKRAPAKKKVDPFADPAYTAAVVDLLGVVAYGEIAAFDRLTEDAALAPSLPDRVEMMQMAAHELAHVQAVQARLVELGADPWEAMEPFKEHLDAFHAHTAPSDWYEGLVKAYIGDSLVADFYKEIAAYLDPTTRGLVIYTLTRDGQADFVIERVRRGVEADPRLAGRLALWGRRLMGEALSQAQRVAAERDALTGLLAGGEGRPALDLAEVGAMFNRLIEGHAERMTRLGMAH